MKSIHVYLLLLCIPLMAMQCKKQRTNINDAPEVIITNTPCAEGDTACELAKLPPITACGANTFGCLLNGKAWVAVNNYPTKRHLEADYYRNQFALEGKLYSKEGQIQITIRMGASNYFFDTDSLRIGTNATGRLTDYSDGCNYYPPPISNKNERFEGYMNILRLDTLNRIISVTFAFTHALDRYTADDQFCSRDTNIVTHGRADILFKL